MVRWAMTLGLTACMLATVGCKDNAATERKYDANIDGKSAGRIDQPPAELTMDQAEVSKKFERSAAAAPSPANTPANTPASGPASAPASGPVPAVEASPSAAPAPSPAAAPTDANAK